MNVTLPCPPQYTDSRTIAALLTEHGIPRVVSWVQDAGPVWAALAYGLDLDGWQVRTTADLRCALFTHPQALPVLAVVAGAWSRPFWASVLDHRPDVVLVLVDHKEVPPDETNLH